MVEPVRLNGSGNAYFEKKYNEATPQAKGKVAYTVKKGNSLWSIARAQVGKNAKQSEIEKYVYDIAKLNNKNTPKKANSLKVNEVIYLPSKEVEKKAATPKKVSAPTTKKAEAHPTAKKAATSPIQKPQAKKVAPLPKQKAATPQAGVKTHQPTIQQTAAQINKILTHPNPHASYSEKTIYKQNQIKKIGQKLYAAHGKAGIKYFEGLTQKGSGNQFYYEKSYDYSGKPSAIVINKKGGNRKYGENESSIYVQLNRQGKVSGFSFNSPGVNINDIAYDYTVDSKGNLKRPNSYGGYYTIETLPKGAITKLTQNLQNLVDKQLNQ